MCIGNVFYTNPNVLARTIFFTAAAAAALAISIDYSAMTTSAIDDDFFFAFIVTSFSCHVSVSISIIDIFYCRLVLDEVSRKPTCTCPFFSAKHTDGKCYQVLLEYFEFSCQK